MKSRVSLKYFVNDCGSLLLLFQNAALGKLLDIHPESSFDEPIKLTFMDVYSLIFFNINCFSDTFGLKENI